MGLLTSASDDNKHVDSDLVVSYSRSRVLGKWTYVSLETMMEAWYKVAWEYHRYARKAYRYVGLSLAAAETIAAQKIAKYQRSRKMSIWEKADGAFEDISGGVYAGAEVNIVQQEGHLYTLEIVVNEDDARLRIDANLSPESLFTTENARDYD